MEDFYSPDELRFVPEGRKGDVRPLLSDAGKTDSKERQSMASSDYFPPPPSVKTDSSNNQRSTPTPETGVSKVTLDPKESAKPVIADKQTLTPVTTGSHEQFVNVSRVADAHLKNSKLDTGDAGVEAPRPTAVVTPSNSGLRSASELTQTASDLVTGRIK